MRRLGIHEALVVALFGIGWLVTGLTDENGSVPDIAGQLDEREMSWRVHRGANAPSGVFSTLLPGVHQIRIVGYVDEAPARKGSIQLEFVVLERGVEQLQIIYFPFDPLHPRFSAGPDHGSVELRIETFEPGLDSARLKASLKGELFYHQSPNTRPIPHRRSLLELDIDTELVRN